MLDSIEGNSAVPSYAGSIHASHSKPTKRESDNSAIQNLANTQKLPKQRKTKGHNGPSSKDKNYQNESRATTENSIMNQRFSFMQTTGLETSSQYMNDVMDI